MHFWPREPSSRSLKYESCYLWFWYWCFLLVPGLIPIFSSKSLRLTKWSGLGRVVAWGSVKSLIATDIVSTEPSVEDQLTDGFLHREILLEVLRISSSRLWLRLFGIKLEVESSEESIRRDLDRCTGSMLLATDIMLGAAETLPAQSKCEENEPLFEPRKK